MNTSHHFDDENENIFYVKQIFQFFGIYELMEIQIGMFTSIGEREKSKDVMLHRLCCAICARDFEIIATKIVWQ